MRFYLDERENPVCEDCAADLAPSDLTPAFSESGEPVVCSLCDREFSGDEIDDTEAHELLISLLVADQMFDILF